MKRYVKKYGNDVELRLEVRESDNLVVKSEVLYNTGSSMKTHLELGFIMGEKSVSSSTCFGGRDWEMLEQIAFAQSEAFYAHGECVESLLIDELIEITT
ncbi:hypothetical protein NVP1084O_139 [Vibrio phage 1.084.O._10N.261.49.F5]|nr:hypothetical protein NVP1084O_139 [Vibrio phage 1.084.O._10N.261.49.F5]